MERVLLYSLQTSSLENCETQFVALRYRNPRKLIHAQLKFPHKSRGFDSTIFA